MAENVLPDSNVYTMSGNVSAPTTSNYQAALDAANKNVTSPNDAGFKPIIGNAGIDVKEPILVQKTVVKNVPTFDFIKASMFFGAAYLVYKIFFKRGPQ